MLKIAARAIVFAAAAMHLGAALAQPAVANAPKLAAPDGSSVVERLGDAMIVSGRPSTIDHIVVSRPSADVIRHYRKALDENASGKVVEYRLKGDQILARKIGEHFVTVRVRTGLDGASDVWIMTSPMLPPVAAKPLPSHLALPAGSRILSNVETLDGDRRAHTVIVKADAAVSATQDFLKRSLGERGFTLVASDASGNDASRRVLLFQRGAEDVMATISDGPAGRTLVLNASGPK